MKFYILAMCVFAAAAAPPAKFLQSGQFGSAPFAPAPAAKQYSGDEKSAEVLRFESNVQPDGYTSYLETSNGIIAQESGTLKKVDNTDAIAVQGSYQYVSPDGHKIEVTYVADENGFQPSGDILPTPPPTPEHVLRLLDFIAKNPPAVETPVAFKKRNF